MAEYLFLHRGSDPLEPIELCDRIHLARRIGVSVIGSDDQTLLPGKVKYMRNVVVRLAGDKNVVILK